MKDKIIIIIISIIAFITIITYNNNTTHNTYYRSAVVVEKENDLTILLDTTGNEWVIDNDLEMYQRYVLLMNDNGTENITDDIIIEIQ